jgi:DNA-binding XRE family transcriptional regulator
MLTAGPQLRAARAMAGLDRGELAKAAGVALITIRRLEAEPGRLRATLTTITGLMRALEARGVVFTDNDKPGVRMRELPA